MPTVVASRGFRVLVLFPPREHGPAHVHVVKSGVEVLINLSDASVREIRGMRDPDVNEAIELVKVHMSACVATWEEIHGAEEE